MSVIYKIRNIVNGHFYVGSSVSVRVRFQYHRRHLRNGTHHCGHLQNAWNKHGEDCFKFEIVEEVPLAENLLDVEGRWLSEHHGKPYCYNIASCPIAPFKGMKHGASAKAKLSDVHKGKQHRLGHTNSPEHRARISAAMKGKKKSPQHVEKIRQRMIGTAYAKGHTVSAEVRALTAKRVAEITSGTEFASVAAAAAHYGIERPNLIRTLRNGGTVKRGPHAGLRFEYVLPPSS